MRGSLLALAVIFCGCRTLTPGGAGVSVYRAPLNGSPAQRSMPGGCRLLSATSPESITELDLEGQKDPFRLQRNQLAAAGGNALLVLTQMTISRHDAECPGSSPITDCPPSFGAWYRYVLEGYVCPAEALETLANAPPAGRAVGDVSLP